MLYDNLRVPNEGETVDQSNIFSNVYFSAVDKKLPGILLTPVCDLVHPEDTQYVQFCAMLPFESYFLNFAEEIEIEISELKNGTLSNEKKGKVTSLLNNFVDNRLYEYHWVGKVPSLEGYYYIQYPLIQTMNMEYLEKNLKDRFAVVESPLRESIFVRYASYMGRVGLKGEKPEKKAYCEEILTSILETLS